MKRRDEMKNRQRENGARREVGREVSYVKIAKEGERIGGTQDNSLRRCVMLC